ncbi:MAG TPA: bifunctional 2-C-methyl-D-erythritol 4-phosphate cytidylyltransferase/2-C-methyl-D-erythritol 2,4-cyclodiphosphate synthase [Paracoccaceae bacterium]|nr:bifunctional 2-C-methyl-D-erythritol 4-phosphate cytidylyltransferase/2-C-methyl-D-erythritol 2,4-cyclodiphosphate synthase [Paracoccaceae bacterium]
MEFAALVVAGGRGLRAGGGTPKQYRVLGGQPLIRHAVARFLAHPGLGRLLVVIHPEDRALYGDALRGIEDPRLAPPVAGGATRPKSVRAGLEALATSPSAPPLVLIHDGARPLVSAQVIDGVLEALSSHAGAFPALPVVDALWEAEGGLARAPRPRAGLWRAQTPQGFRLAEILAAHRAHRGEADDDVAIARAAGLAVAVTPGAEENFKITGGEDFARAARLLEGGMEYRTGQGFDVHRFGEGDHVTLGGVRIPHDCGVVAHSDGDVALHAITDALFGALAEGDIGRWFPPAEPRWRGAASSIFLAKAAERMAARGGRVVHVDCTLVCERPKIAPHAEAMRANIAAILGIGAERVSIKATTSERLGFTGRGEGIAALATATVALP